MTFVKSLEKYENAPAKNIQALPYPSLQEIFSSVSGKKNSRAVSYSATASLTGSSRSTISTLPP
jgi:hypothetical protein